MKTIPNYTKDDVKTTPKETVAIITNIEIHLAKQLYGEKAKKNPDQEIFVLRLENKDLDIITEQSMPKYEVGEVPDNSKLGKFLTKYDGLEVGMAVTLDKDEKGFWKLKVD